MKWWRASVSRGGWVGLLLATGPITGCGTEQAAVAPTPPLTEAGAGAGLASGGVAGAAVVPLSTGGLGLGGAASVGAAAAGSGGAVGPPMDTSGELYDAASLPRFDLELPPESLSLLAQTSDAYAPGSLRYSGELVSQVGVRIKGEGSLRSLDEKAAFKLKFDEFVPQQTFHGLRRMTLNNMVEDPSFLAERLAFYFFRAAGLPAPRCNNALVYVNGEFFGVYANVEAEDKTFLRRWFASDAGNLYEEGQVDFEPGAETAFDLETNEAVNDRSDLVRLIAAVQSAKPASWLADMGAQLDVSHFLKFTAAEAAVNQWDMYAYTVFYPNNFRLYHDPASATFVFLPWGMDMSMKPFRDSGKPYIDVLGLARQGDSDAGPISAGLIFRRCLLSAPCKAAYAAVVEETASLYEGAGLLALSEQYYEQIKTHVDEDPRKEYSLSQFEAGYQSLRATIAGRSAALRQSLAD